MLARRLTPILNVSDIQQSFAWFEKLGWKKGWEWGTPPDFGGVCSGECEIFLCQGAQGGRGRAGSRARSVRTVTKPPTRACGCRSGSTMSMPSHQRCLEQGLEVTWPPTDMPWNVREMHVRHPDGHVFRISRGIGEDAE